MRRALAAIVIVVGLGATAGAGPASPRYAETLWLNDDGSARIEAEVDLAAGMTSPLRIPAAGRVVGLTATGPDGVSASTVQENGRDYIVLEFRAPITEPITLRLRADAPDYLAAMKKPAQEFGDRTMTYRFLNTTSTTFVTVRNQVVLPPGFVVTAIDDSEPPVDTASTAPPYTVQARDDRRAVSIASDDVELGDAAAVTFRFKRRRIPLFVPFALLVLGLVHLFMFRSLINGRDVRP